MRRKGGLQQAGPCLLLLALLLAGSPPPVAAGTPSEAEELDLALSSGSAKVTTGQQFLQAVQDGTGDIQLDGPVTLTPEVLSKFQLPIVLQPNTTMLVHHHDPSGLGLRQEVINWGSALNVIEVAAGSTLAFDGIISQNPGNFTKGLELPVELKVNGSFLWPTVTGQVGSNLIISNSTVNNDDPNCSPETTQAAVLRFQGFLPPSIAAGIRYLGGTSAFFAYLPFPTPIYNVSSQEVLGAANLTLIAVTNDCSNSLDGNSDQGGGGGGGSTSSGGGGGGTPAWVWAVVGSVAGCAALAAVGAALLWRRKRKAQLAASAAAAAAAAGAGLDEETGSGGGKLVEQPRHGGQLHADSNGSALSWDSRFISGSAATGGTTALRSGSGGGPEMHAALMRARFGVIEDLQLGDMLGRGAFGRVYKGRWKGALVAVKLIETRVMPGRTHDLSREPLLSMSISHPNIVSTHQVVVVRLVTPEELQQQAAAAATADGEQTATEQAANSGSGSGGGRVVPALSGSGGQVELVSPHEVLQPGLYESWLVVEYCDRGSLADLISARKHIPADPSQREIWALLTLLDIALGLHYLHSNGIVHGDLKPANVMLKSTRACRRGFTAKLADFGLSRALVGEQTHVETQSYGTASYAAPELLNHGKLAAAADIYSFSLIMWELMSDADLYHGMASMQIIVQVSQNKYRPELPERAPPALLDLMQRCWDHEPSRRPTSAQLVEELRGQLMALRPQPSAAASRGSGQGSAAGQGSG